MSAPADKGPAVVIGAGPAGLAAAYELAQRGVPVTLVEKDRQPGGLAKTVEYKGFRFDIGGHRFFTKIAVIEHIWKALLGDDLLVRPRLSRIFYRGKFYYYPLKLFDAMRKLGLLTSLAVLLSYLRMRLSPIRPEKSFADWVSNRFGKRLYAIFFRTYTEKVWGIPCETISAHWAAQRIRGLSLFSVVMDAVTWRGRKKGNKTIRTLVDEFYYPRLGPGMMWDALLKRIVDNNGTILVKSTVVRIMRDGYAISGVALERDGKIETLPASHLLSSMPLRELITVLSPQVPGEVADAAQRLKYRDFLTVAVIVDVPNLFPDNWLYIHDESVRVGRIQNFKNWSPEMVPDPSLTCLGMEYFCFEGDDLWSMPDQDLLELAKRELSLLGLVSPERVIDGIVVRMPKAYPVYDEASLAAINVIRDYLQRFRNLQEIGRNGMHKYNNMDHSMLTALLAVRNLFGERHDLWDIDAGDEYAEEIQSVEIAAEATR